MQIRRLGNSGIYVTCNCLLRAAHSAVRQWKHNGTKSKHLNGKDFTAMTSLGDFDVGAPMEELLYAYNLHLKPLDQDWQE